MTAPAAWGLRPPPRADEDRRITGWILVPVAAAAASVGLVSLETAWHTPGISVYADSIPSAIVMLSAGLALVIVGLESIRRRGRLHPGMLLAWAGLAWLFAAWGYPAIGSPLAFTAGLAIGWLAPAAITHALFALARGRAARGHRVMVAIGYGVFGIGLGMLPAMTFDAHASGCAFCPPDLLAVAPSVAFSRAAITFTAASGAAFAVAAAATLVLMLLGQPAGRAHRAAFLIPGMLYLLAVAVELGRSVGIGTIPSDRLTHTIELLQATLLGGVALGIALEWWRARRLRSRIAGVVASLVGSPPIGALRDALASSLGDPALRLVYPLEGDAAVDAEGHPMRPDMRGRTGRAVTRVLRDGAAVAIIDHRADDPRSIDMLGEVIRAAQLGLEHERLQAVTRAQLASLTAARKRIVAAATDERRRLERDLHDSAQQQLIAIAVGVRLLAAETSGSDDHASALVDEVTDEINRAIDELREIARGIYPSVLADEGLAAAIEGLAEGAGTPVEVGAVEVDPLEPPVAEAAYAIVSEVVAQGEGHVRVHAKRSSGSLRLVIEGPDLPADLLVELGDRVGAVDGVLVATHPGPDRTELTAEIPCAS